MESKDRKSNKLQYVSGTIFEPGTKPFRGYLGWRNGSIVEVNHGTPPVEPIANGIITPLFVNGHTHIGDSILAGRIDTTLGLEEIVSPPDGIKHRLLGKTSDSEIIRGMMDSMGKMAASGTYGFLDFREGGMHGARLLADAYKRFSREKTNGSGISTPFVFSRPSKLNYDRDEVAKLLENSAGIGISAMRDWEYPELEKVACHVHRKGKFLAMHASESVREDIDAILDLKPDILVHLCSATSPDLERVADAGVQVVICPQSNSLFGLRSDIPLMMELDIPLTLGTDNLMFTPPDIFGTMKFVNQLYKDSQRRDKKNISADETISMCGHRMKKLLNVKSGVSPNETAGFMVVPNQETDLLKTAQSIIWAEKPSLIVSGIYHLKITPGGR